MDDYNLPFDPIEIKKSDKYTLFKQNNKQINKTVFALNNIPSDIHSLLFSNYEYVCPKYYFITLQLDEEYTITNLLHNFDDLDDYLGNDKIRFIYIRINLIQKGKKINHVNCIIIDKINKYLLLFEPKVNIKYDINILFSFLDGVFGKSKFKKLFPKDIGYHSFNKLQSFDLFCQTYVLFIYIIIILNYNTEPKNFSIMFNQIINSDSIQCFLFTIYEIITINGYIINKDNLITYSTCSLRNIFNIFHCHNHIYENNLIKETEKEDIVLIELSRSSEPTDEIKNNYGNN